MKLNAINLVDEGVYLIESGYYGFGTLEVDGLPLPPNRQVAVGDLSKIVSVETRSGEVIAQRATDGSEMPVAEFEAAKRLRLQGATQDEDSLEWLFPSLDAEFAYRRFVAEWPTQVRAPNVVERKPVEIVVTEVRLSTGDPDIVSLWNAPHVARDATLYSFDRLGFGVRLLASLAKEAGLALDRPTHSGLRFAKLDGEYAFDESFELASGREKHIGTLESCKAEKAALDARIRNIVERHAIRKSGKRLTNAGDVLIALADLRQRLASVTAKGAAGSETLSNVRKRIGDLMQEIQQGRVAPLP